MKHSHSTSSSDSPRSALRTGQGAGWRLGRLFGIEIRLAPSLLIIFSLIAVTLGTGTFPAWHPEWSALTVGLCSLFAALAFLLSILAHELSHAVVGRALGVDVQGITLFLFGGVTKMGHDSRSPKTELLMTVVGPLTSLLLGFLGLWAAVWLGGGADLAHQDPVVFMQSASPVASVLAWLGPVNIFLAAFNMIPGFPLDGGRVFRAILWWATGDLHRATAWASRVGQGVGLAFVVLGVLMMFGGGVPFFGRGLANGLWLSLLGWLLASAAKSTYANLVTREVLADTPVARLMREEVQPVDAKHTVAQLVEEVILRSEQSSFPVLSDGKWVGLVTMDEVRRVPHTDWEHETVEHIMIPRERLITVTPEGNVDSALKAMAKGTHEQILVEQGGTVRGFLRQRDVLKWIALQTPVKA